MCNVCQSDTFFNITELDNGIKIFVCQKCGNRIEIGNRIEVDTNGKNE